MDIKKGEAEIYVNGQLMYRNQQSMNVRTATDALTKKHWQNTGRGFES